MRIKTISKFFFSTVLLGYLYGCSNAELTEADQAVETTAQKPNFIIIYADDLGYGDVSSYGAAAINTPNIDKLAETGIRLTDAHATAATCTPSRYSVLTGEYGFRSNAAILAGDAPALIPPGKPTIASALKSLGYTTGVVGKWHLGLGNGDIDWNGDISPGPLDIGFDYSFLLPATGDRVPTVYVENKRVIDLDPSDPILVDYTEKIGDRPTGTENPELLRVGADPQHSNTIVNGVSRIGFMDGGKSAEWVDEDFPDVFNAKAVEFIQENKSNPFFLFYSFHDPHVPRLPHPRFQGVTELGPRGDAIVQLDWMTGQIAKEVEALGIAENTIIVFSSDNGPVLNDGYDDQAIELLGDHAPAGPFRGGKYSAFEAGARVPTIVSWPGNIEPTVSNALVSQVDLFASFVKLAGGDPDTTPYDSQDHSAAFLGKDDVGRDILFKESAGTVSLRNGSWKYIAPIAKGNTNPEWLFRKGIEGGLSFEPQLFNLEQDIGETENLADKYPGQVLKMELALSAIVAEQ